MNHPHFTHKLQSLAASHVSADQGDQTPTIIRHGLAYCLGSLLCGLMLLGTGVAKAMAADETESPALDLPRIEGAKPRNVLFVLTDDHRFDALEFLGHPFLKTPHMNRLAREGVHFSAGYVTTSLCSPSRASILTGRYAHNHQVIDNNNPEPPGTIFFAQYLQKIGYQTSFFGKWHMGAANDDPRPGFDRWVSFRGQGHYAPHPSGLNVDGKRVPRAGYITDELTDYCVDWLKQIDIDRPFFAYLSHKAVHAEFLPAERHKGAYADIDVEPPVTQEDSEKNYKGKPRWVKDQRNSWHGVDFPYHSRLDVVEYYKRYCETLLAVDESLGRVMQTLEERGVLDETLIIYMGDNGFCFGEHGLIDKRNAYEASMRVPFLARCPDLFEGGQEIDQVVANIDIAPTILEAAGLQTPPHMDGRSFLRLMQGKEEKWRDSLLYEYYWERNFPQTPTMFALRTDRYKLIVYQGIWDIDELYDMREDPQERQNLIFDSEMQPLIEKLKKQLFDELEVTGGMQMPLYPHRGRQQNLRSRSGSRPGNFAEELYRD